jgi:hypothetical protein
MEKIMDTSDIIVFSLTLLAIITGSLLTSAMIDLWAKDIKEYFRNKKK